MTKIKRVVLKNRKRDYHKVRDLFYNLAQNLERSHEITGEPYENLEFRIDTVFNLNPLLYQVLKDSGIEFEEYH